MKIAIIGYSGSGKSTLARKLGNYYNCNVLHLDSIHFAPNWEERKYDDMIDDVSSMLEKRTWIIEGNYKKLLYQERLADADQIIFFDFNRFNCLWRAFKRYCKFRGKTRPDIANGCPEKLDFEFISWILKDGRSDKQKSNYKQVIENYPQKIKILKHQRDLDQYLKNSLLHPIQTLSRAYNYYTDSIYSYISLYLFYSYS